MKYMKIKKGDQIQVIAGKDRGKRGKVLRTLPVNDMMIVEGLNIMKKHVRAKRSGEKGQRVEIPKPIYAAKVMIVCPKCGKTARLGSSVAGDQKVRICKKCKGEI